MPLLLWARKGTEMIRKIGKYCALLLIIFKKMSQRLQYLLQLLESGSTDAFVLFAIAKEYENAGDDAQALAYYVRLMETDSGYVGLYYHLGKLYEKLSDTKNAREIYQKGIETSKMAGDRHALSELQGALLNLDYA
jgi:tetratricopeptide (TPR) repeat protein